MSLTRAARRRRAMRRSPFFVVLCTYSRNHGLLERLHVSWLSRVPHVVLTNVPLNATGHGHLDRQLNVRVQQGDHYAHVGVRNIDWKGHRKSDHRQTLAVSDGNASATKPFQWLVLVDDDTVVLLPRLWMDLKTVDHRQPLFLGLRMSAGRTGPGVAPPGTGCTIGTNWRGPCFTHATPPSKCTTPGNALPARSSRQICDIGAAGHGGDGMPKDLCLECFCPVTAAGGGRYRLDQTNGQASLSSPAFYAYGGTGIIMSQGLVDGISRSSWEECAAKLPCGPSDFRIAACVYNLRGIGMGAMPRTQPWTDERRFFRDVSAAEQDEFLESTVAKEWPWSFHKVVDGNNADRLHRNFRRALRRRIFGGVIAAAAESYAPPPSPATHSGLWRLWG